VTKITTQSTLNDSTFITSVHTVIQFVNYIGENRRGGNHPDSPVYFFTWPQWPTTHRPRLCCDARGRASMPCM